jgi:hypothetical protein
VDEFHAQLARRSKHNCSTAHRKISG